MKTVISRFNDSVLGIMFAAIAIGVLLAVCAAALMANEALFAGLLGTNELDPIFAALRVALLTVLPFVIFYTIVSTLEKTRSQPRRHSEHGRFWTDALGTFACEWLHREESHRRAERRST